MVTPAKLSPRTALTRWVGQLHYNSIRNIETVCHHVITDDKKRPLRGFKLATDLVITRKRTFYKIEGTRGIPLSVEEVAANYNLESMQEIYRAAAEEWKNEQRKRRRRSAS